MTYALVLWAARSLGHTDGRTNGKFGRISETYKETRKGKRVRVLVSLYVSDLPNVTISTRTVYGSDYSTVLVRVLVRDHLKNICTRTLLHISLWYS